MPLFTKLTIIILVQFSRSVVSESLWAHELQHPRPPCPSPTPGVHSNSGPSSGWCHPAISSSRPLFLLPPIPPSIRVFSNYYNIIHYLLGNCYELNSLLSTKNYYRHPSCINTFNFQQVNEVLLLFTFYKWENCPREVLY